MEAVTEKSYQAKEFAEKAGVTVRTLHFYDQRGLLKPAGRTEAGYRLYGEAELERLEQICALRFVGFNLDQIEKLLGGAPHPLAVALRMQRAIVGQQQRRLERAARAIDDAQRRLEANQGADRWTILRDIIEVFRMENDDKWTENYYSSEAKAKLEARRAGTSPSVAEQGQRDWAALIADVEAAVAAGQDPIGERAVALATRWRALIQQFTQNDAEISEGLNELWSDQTHWPKDFKRPWSDAADDFIHRALDCRR
jgi:MerR family transcriptional regulator, thiopeptide resistance regulator